MSKEFELEKSKLEMKQMKQISDACIFQQDYDIEVEALSFSLLSSIKEPVKW